jgi:aldehyde dehydrogenase (NAD+)
LDNILQSLGIEKNNYGACMGAGKWSTTTDAGKLQSINPSTGKEIASVYQCSEADYDQIMNESIESFKEWRMVPAPIRGQLVREMAEELRKKKDLLGSLVALEMGKIKAEGDGEVQEMIDIADFSGLRHHLQLLSYPFPKLPNCQVNPSFS